MQDTEKLVVFDIDGTLVNSQHAHMQAIKEAWEQGVSVLEDLPENFYTLSDEDLRYVAGYGHDYDYSVEQIIRGKLLEAHLQLRPSEEDALAESIFESLDPEVYQARKHALEEAGQAGVLYDGIVEMLEELKGQGYKLAAMTTRQEAFNASEQETLAPYFDQALALGGRKTAEHLREIMEELGVSPENTVMVGDQVNDMAPAFDAGAHPVHVQWGYGIYMEAHLAEVIHQVLDVTDLPTLIDNLIGPARGETAAPRRIGPTASDAHPLIKGADTSAGDIGR